MHPVHVSVLNVEYSSKEKAATISVKAFPDDLELAFMHNYNIMLNLGKDNINPEWEKYVNIYFKKMFSFQINNKTNIPLVFKSYEIKDDAIFLYFSAPVKGKINSIQINNRFLLDVFENQNNLLIISFDGNEKGYNLNSKNYKIDFKL